ncbi:MAG: hypothetical protein Q8K36_07255 [Alphaproteobacteria bacterium]|nr:hypothetical protein [Alphaproteobacteria bacterium]
MNKTSDKVIAAIIVGFIAIIWFILTPLWIGICFVIPGAYMLWKLALNQKISSVVPYNSSRKQFLRSSSSSHKTYFQSRDYKSSSHRYGMNCRNMSDRKNRYGF